MAAATAAPAAARLPCAPLPGLPPELAAALAPDEDASAFLARCAADPLPSGLPLVGALRPGEVLELVGPSGSGKTALLVQVAATAILPDTWEGVPVGGRAGEGVCRFVFFWFAFAVLARSPTTHLSTKKKTPTHKARPVLRLGRHV
jgi:hypothetical protein